MKKKQSVWRLQVKVILILFSVIMTFTGTAFAKVPGCTVGNTSQGYWISLPQDTGCLIPGPPAAASDWPTTFESLTPKIYPYRIELKYKVTVDVSGIGSYDPPSFPKCISGLTEAYAQIYAQYNQEVCDNNPQCVNSYTAEGSSSLTIDTYNTYYLTFFESIRVSEWRCNDIEPAEKEVNQGPPYCEVNLQ